MADFADDATQTILDRLEAGEALTQICKDDGLPSAPTFLRWCDKDQELAEQYARASKIGYDVMADKALEEARTAKDASLGRLSFDAARWWLGKRAPKRYGDKLAHVGGDDGDTPIQHSMTVNFVKSSAG